MSEELQGVAIVGMAGRFPNANSIAQFWRNMVDGIDCTRLLSREEIIASGVDPRVADDPSYIRRVAQLEDIDLFDAGFFDYLPTEASIVDPQVRLFLECVQLALDDAGCDPERYPGSVGVYAGTGLNNYLLKNLMRQPGFFEDVLDFQKIISNDKDFLSTQVNYKFNLSGPGLTVQTACSTSLVAIQLAYQSLLTYQCDVAISGGTHIRSPRAKGMLYKEGEIYSPDGVCRPFDKRASGTIFGEGAGVVILKRLEDALEDRDHIYGVIRGAALNNDGSKKVSFAAPSVKGQAEVIALAHTLAGVEADEIGYIEAHGTGTKLGDPIEVRALSQAFQLTTQKKNYCTIGSGKSMIGHLDVAAGVAGLIRATLALHHKTIPATLHFEAPNPELKLEDSPFRIQAKSSAWESNKRPRIAAVSSFGVGGTNAHAIIQEAPNVEHYPTQRALHILPLSAKSVTALDAQAAQLADFLKQHPELEIADIAHTLQTGRRQFSHRRAIVCDSVEDAAAKLESGIQTASVTGASQPSNAGVLFLFSGQGSQHIGMCRDLYLTEPVFKKCLDDCAAAVQDILEENFLECIFAEQSDKAAAEKLRQTRLAQPCLYAVECGLAKLWSTYGVQPVGMIGHSIGEFAAAHLAGVFSLEDGARIVATRGKLMQQMQPGSMLSLRNAADDVEAALEGRDVSVVVLNGPELTVVGGSVEAIAQLKAELEAEEIACTLLHTSHAFHSSMMDDAVEPFVEEIRKYKLHPPSLPFVSNVTGDWISAEQATDAAYWGKQLRSPVQFATGIDTLCATKNGILLEVGPSQALNILCREQSEQVKNRAILASARHPKQRVNDAAYFYRAFAGLWANGVAVDLNRFYADEKRSKLSLPGYVFERKRYWIDSAYPAGLDKPQVSAQLVTRRATESSSLLENAAESREQSVFDIVATLWQEMLGCGAVGPQDNFFDLGGHSLVATQMLATLQEKFGKKIPLEYLNSSGNLESFCLAIEDLVGALEIGEPDTKSDRKTDGLQKSNAERWPLSPQQQRLWFFHELASDDPAYNLAQPIYFEGRLDVDKLKQAVDVILGLHESFNTVFAYDENDQPYAYRLSSSVVSVVEQLEGADEAERESQLVEQIVSRNAKAKDFSELMVDARIFILSDERAVLILFVPHLITDGLSFNTFYQQLHQAYSNLLAGRDAVHGIDVPYQYSDYVNWLLENPKPAAPEALEFWQAYLADVPDLIQLPTNFVRPNILSSHGSAIHFGLSEEQSNQVRQICKQLQITPFVFFLSLLYLTLWKYSGQSTHVVGAPYANRRQKGTRDIVGFFVDMIPIRGDIDSLKTYSEWVTEISRSFARAWDNFDIGLDKIVEASGVSRHNNAHPLFQVTFTYLSYLDSVLGNDEFSMRQLLVDRGVSEYDLSLYMWEDDAFSGVFEFATDLFNAETIERLSEHFVSIVDWALLSKDEKLADIVLVDSDDLPAIEHCNQTQRAEFRDQHVIDLFRQSVARYADKTALRAKSVELNYRELDNASSQLASALQAGGIGKNSFVGVHTERSLNTVIALLAIFKTGAAYIPLDAGFPTERLRYIVEDSGVTVILADDSTRDSELLKTPGVEAIVLEDVPSTEPAVFAALTAPQELAYVLYTSGSTGKPKGVPIRHDSLANFLLSSAEEPGISSEDRLLAITTTSFDISFLELLLPLISGATVVVADSLSVKDGAALASMIEGEAISVVQATPVTWTILLDSGWKGKPGLKMLSGGEALKADLASRLLDKGGELWNAYGPTECTIWSSYARIESANDEPHIGVPIANTRYYILDEHNHPLPAGVVGELAIGGIALSPGYFNRDDLTEKVFVEVSIPGSAEKILVYKTGDLAQLTAHGNFRCLGRKDFQVKIRGFRIELGEIESQLGTHEKIHECCCVVLENSPTDKKLVVYYRSAHAIDSAELRDFLLQKLPPYMTPSLYVFIEEFPKTANQKIDRKGLPKPALDLELVYQQSATPLSVTERKIAEIWSEVLERPIVDAEANFFELGGHSLLAAQVIRRMNEQIQDVWQVRDLFMQPTVRELGKRLSSHEAHEGVVNLESQALQRVEVPRWPLSVQQQRLWFFHEFSEDSPAYNLAQAIRFEGKVELYTLKHAVETALRLNESFNTVFTYDEKDHVYASRLQTSITALIVHFDGESEEEREKQLAEEIIQHNRIAKDFSAASTEVRIYVVNDERAYIVLYAPHLVTDGLSFNIFYHQLSRIYENLNANRSPLDAVEAPFQYSDYVHWLNERPTRESKDSIDFWARYLEGVPDLIQLPTTYSRPPVESNLGSAFHFALDDAQSSRVRAFCQQLQITPFVFFLSQLYITLWKYSGQSSIVVGAPYANRANDDIKSIVGFFVEMIPVRGNIDSSKNFESWVKDVSESFLEAWGHSDLGLDKIVEASGVERNTNAHPLFQVAFTYLSYLKNAGLSNDYSMRQVAVNRGVSEYDLTLYMWEDENFSGMFEFAKDLFDAQTIERLSEHFVTVIEWVLEDSERPLAEFELAGPSDIAVIEHFNKTQRSEFAGQHFVPLFQQVVEKHADSIALRANGVSLNYCELDNASSRLAQQLQAAGVGNGSFVGVYLERGLNTVISVVAIYKCGAAYLPMDPGFPTERLRYIVENSGVNVVLTDNTNKDSELLLSTGVTSIVLDERPNVDPVENYSPMQVEPEGIAYILYTSGSTGLPKGVPIRHESLASLLLYSQEQPGISSTDRMLAFTTTSFDISFIELLLPLLKGASVVVADSLTAKDGEALATFIDAEDITYMQATPVTWTLLLDSGWKGKPGLKMITGGEALKRDLAGRLLQAGEELWNGYGPTECTIYTSFARIYSDLEPTIGKPVANTEYYILDESNHVLPPGIVGELAVSGILLSPGYYNRNELTEKAFVDIQIPGRSEKTRVYKTGDLAQLTADGNYRCLGRKDFQVKIRGFRIELGEIESQLGLIEEVDECCCIVQENGDDKQLVAYYRSNQAIPSSELREALGRKLPPYMVPRVFMHMEDFPRTANQKIDRKALPAFETDFTEDDSNLSVVPMTPFEQEIALVWGEVLGGKIVNSKDDFFSLGGHSLLAAQVVRKMNDQIKPLWKVRDLFLHPTIHELSKFAANEDSISESLSEEKTQPSGEEGGDSSGLIRSKRERWPLSKQQQRLWFFHEFVSDDPAYNLAMPFCFEGKIDREKLKIAVDYVLSLHESFNTVFAYNDDNHPYATCLERPVKSEFVELSGTTSDARELELSAEVLRKNTQAKDFSQANTEALIYVISDTKLVMVLYTPHLIVDGYSFNLFLQQLKIAYDNLLNEKEVGANISVPYQYSDYVSWQQESTTETDENAVAFWKKYLADVPDLVQLPMVSPRPVVVSSRGAGVEFALSEHQSDQVRAICKQLKITPFVFFLSQLFITLWKYTGQNTQVVGAPYANRDNEALRNIVGFFVDMIPIRGDIDANRTFEEWVPSVNMSFVEAWDHMELGLDTIIEVSDVTRHTNAHPLFQVAFTYFSYMEDSDGSSEYSMRQSVLERGVSEYDLSLDMWEERSFAGLFEFATDLFSAEMIEGLSERFVAVINWVLEDSNRPLSELVLINQQDLSLIENSNNYERPEFLNLHFVPVFRQTVERFGDNTAVRAHGYSLTYRELDNASDHIALQLKAAGVEAGGVVGVYLERGLYSVISIVAIFKCRATYIPLETKFPTERLRYVVEQADVKVLLTDADNENRELCQLPDVKALCVSSEPDVTPVSTSSRFDDEDETFDPNDNAYTIYTSGSTGRPKGVPIRHESMVNTFLNSFEAPGVDSHDRLLAISTTSFDMSVLELVLPLLSGASVMVASSMAAQDGSMLAELIEEGDITYVQATPVTWTLLLDAGWKGKDDLKMFIGGEALKPDLASRLQKAGGELWNAYGPTECAMVTSYSRILPGNESEIDIGRAFANVGYYVIDDDNNLLPPGITGELAISGVALSPGYHKREDLTRNAFVEIQIPGRTKTTSVYKTGDLAVLLPNGAYRIIGRKDFQVKIRGFRIELGEIEKQLDALETIDECCCVVLEESGEKRLVVYYRSASPLQKSELRSFLGEKLPPYMVPRTFVHMDDFPRSANQKIDRKRLPAPTKEQMDDSSAKQLKSLKPSEKKIIEIWSEVLGTEDIGADDDFFDLGGHSILAAQVIRLMNQEIEPLWQVRDLFTHPTVGQLALKVKDDEKHDLPLVFPVQSKGKKIPFFLVAGVYADEYKGDYGQREYEEGFLGYFSNIINIIGRDRPIYGLRAKGMFSGETVHQNVSEMADEYVKKMTEIYPEGPLIVGGECLGGNVAYEIAQKLLKAGREVKLLVLMDTVRPCLSAQFYYIFRFFLRVLRKKLRGKNVFFRSDSQKYAFKLVKYRIKPYPGHVLILVNEQWVKSSALIGWDFNSTPNMSFDVLKGDHTTRLTEYGSMTASVLDKHLSALD